MCDKIAVYTSRVKVKPNTQTHRYRKENLHSGTRATLKNEISSILRKAIAGCVHMQRLFCSVLSGREGGLADQCAPETNECETQRQSDSVMLFPECKSRKRAMCAGARWWHKKAI